MHTDPEIRAAAVKAAASQRQRLVAQIEPDAPAKVDRLGPMPRAFAERSEPTPYEKFGGSR